MLNYLVKLLKYTPFIFVGAGMLFLILFFVGNSPAYIQAFFTRVDHPQTYTFKSYDKLLSTFVKDGLVDYKNLSKSKLLSDAMEELAHTSPKKFEKEEKLCYWLNAYNLIIIKIIADKYPVRKLHELGVDRASKKFIVGGKVLSSQKILSKKLNPLIRKYKAVPEIVFLICGGTLNYPPLLDRAIVPAHLEADAKVAAYKFITNKKNVYFNQDKGIFYISNLMRRYKESFERAGYTPYSFTILYLDPKNAPNLTDIMITRTYFSKVDYRINDYQLIMKKNMNKTPAKKKEK